MLRHTPFQVNLVITVMVCMTSQSTLSSPRAFTTSHNIRSSMRSYHSIPYSMTCLNIPTKMCSRHTYKRSMRCRITASSAKQCLISKGCTTNQDTRW